MPRKNHMTPQDSPSAMTNDIKKAWKQQQEASDAMEQRTRGAGITYAGDKEFDNAKVGSRGY